MEQLYWKVVSPQFLEAYWLTDSVAIKENIAQVQIQSILKFHC